MKDKFIILALSAGMVLLVTDRIVSWFEPEPEPIRTEQDIKNEIELNNLKKEVQNLRTLERMEHEIIIHHDEIINSENEGIKTDSTFINDANRKRLDSLRAAYYGM